MTSNQSRMQAFAGDTVRPVDPEARYLDLIVRCLRDACETQGDVAFPLIAQMIDQHIAGSLEVPRVGRWRNEALDGLLMLISPRMPAQVERLHATARRGRSVALD